MSFSLRLRKLGESGMVSIIVTMVLIIVMTLVVLGMSRNSIREQRQALDRQLSDQAFYNAESGIGDWAKHLSDPANALLPVDKTTCDDSGYNRPAGGNQIGPDTENTYSCLLYDKAPRSIILSDLSISDSKTIPITSATGISSLVFSWTSSSAGGTVTSGCSVSAGGALPTTLGPTNCNLGGLKVDLVDPGVLNRTALTTNNFIAYLLPNNGGAGATLNYASGRGNSADPVPSVANQGLIGVANCANGTGCSISINFSPNNLPSNSTLFLHLRSLYQTNNVVITGIDSAGNPVRFINSQIMIDATGKAKDVLRRVQVRVGATSQYAGTDFSLRTADSICKLIDVNKDAVPATAAIDARCL
jgi:PilX N-terminal